MSKITQANKKAKAKKLTKDAAARPIESEAVSQDKIEFCCKCKYHENRPSFCRKNKKYVGRKAPACADAK